MLQKLRSFFATKPIQRKPELFSIALFVFATIQIASLLSFSYNAPDRNILGLFGYISAVFWYFLFGPISIFGIAYLYHLSWNWWNKKFHSSSTIHLTSYIVALTSSSLLIALIASLLPQIDQAWAELIGIPLSSKRALQTSVASYFPASGYIANFLYHKMPYVNFETLFSVIGTALISSTTLGMSLTLLFDVDIKTLFYSWLPPYGNKQKEHEPTKTGLTRQKTEDLPIKSAATSYKARIFPEIVEEPIASKSESPQPLSRKLLKQEALPTPIHPQNNYPLPEIDLLTVGKKVDSTDLKNELKTKADLLEETLLSFGIEAKVGQIHRGPTVTMFEVQPAVGVKIGKIKTLEHDIALNMEAKSIRIIAPIPGKAAVGIEVPNQIAEEVNFREAIASYLEKGSAFKVPMLLGKAVNGELVMTDLTKMPHCIIAGATGSGKSVCINSIIMSIIMLARPEEIRLLMIDPKKVELTPYTKLPHMLAPVITEPNDAAQALNWLVREMEKRYEILKLTGQRNIDSFNKRKKNRDQEGTLPLEIPETLPYYVAIIDELADLMMVSSQDIETPIARIAQMARAVGIHLILATQRPSREVITGIIKANFPARIAFKVASRINSQIIIDDIGAETLLGNGDMLFLLPGSSQLLRCQGVYVRDEEIVKVIEDISSKRPTNYVIQSFQKQDGSFGEKMDGDESELDSLFHEAKNVVFGTGNASTTFLQRKLKIGYARAASIMDQLEENGIIGPQDGAKPRKIFFPKKSNEASEETILNDDTDEERGSTPSDNMQKLSRLRNNSFSKPMSGVSKESPMNFKEDDDDEF